MICRNYFKITQIHVATLKPQKLALHGPSLPFQTALFIHKFGRFGTWKVELEIALDIRYPGALLWILCLCVFPTPHAPSHSTPTPPHLYAKA